MARKDWHQAFFDQAYVEVLKRQTNADLTCSQVDFIEQQLNLQPPARILDVACGFGRHAIELARRGYEAMGVDSSSAMLAEARTQARRIRGVSFRQLDMRRLTFDGQFDGVVNLFTSFGYFSHRDNVIALKRMGKALRPGGRILIDTRDRGFDTKMHGTRGNHYRYWSAVGSDHIVAEETDFEAGTGVLRNKWFILKRRGHVWKRVDKELVLQVYSRGQWNEMLRQCGLRRVAFLGDYGQQKSSRKQGPRLIVIAARPRQ